MQQTVFKPQQNNNGNTQTNTMIITAITLFALVGLILGLAVGAFTRPPHTSSPIVAKNNTTPTVAMHTPTLPSPTPTLSISQVGMGCPKILDYPATQQADNTTSYTVRTQAMDKSGGTNPPPCGTGKALLAPDLTCKIWLTKDQDALQKLSSTSSDELKAVDKLQTPFPNEEQNALIFDGTSQVQPCSQTGPTVWKYKLANTVAPGTYYLAVLTDWKGQQYNWLWNLTEVTK